MGNETAIIFFIFFISLTQNSRIFGVLCMKPHDFNFQLKKVNGANIEKHIIQSLYVITSDNALEECRKMGISKRNKK